MRARAGESVGVPDVAELLALAFSAGLTAGAALALVASALGEGHPLGSLVERVERGEPIGGALADLSAVLGDSARPLADALVMHVRYGLPVIETLQRIAFQARLDERLAAETRARQLPVALLFPLVFCILPSFVLLTVVPLVISTVGSLRS